MMSGLTGGGVTSGKFIFHWLVFWIHKCFMPDSYSFWIISLSAKTLSRSTVKRFLSIFMFLRRGLQSSSISHTAVTDTPCLWIILFHREGLCLPYSHDPTTASLSIPCNPMHQTQWPAGMEITEQEPTLLRSSSWDSCSGEKGGWGSDCNWVPTVR